MPIRCVLLSSVRLPGILMRAAISRMPARGKAACCLAKLTRPLRRGAVAAAAYRSSDTPQHQAAARPTQAVVCAFCRVQ